MRLRHEEWPLLNPDDVAWVAEWQLAVGIGWLPVKAEGSVIPDHAAAADGRHWCVTVQAGDDRIRIPLPIRDLAKVIRWCHGLDTRPEHTQPPPGVRASMLTLRNAMRRLLRNLDPLGRMGYLDHHEPLGRGD